MLEAEDFIRLPFTADLTQAGIVYACRSLPYTYDRVGGTRFTRLRRIVVGKAVELGLRRLLAERQVPFDQRGSTPFTDPDRYDLALGGRRVDVKSFLLSERVRIREVHSHSRALLEAAALVPADQAGGEHLRDHDLYLFAFALALLAVQPARSKKRPRRSAVLLAASPARALGASPGMAAAGVAGAQIGGGTAAGSGAGRAVCQPGIPEREPQPAFLAARPGAG